MATTVLDDTYYPLYDGSLGNLVVLTGERVCPSSATSTHRLGPRSFGSTACHRNLPEARVEDNRIVFEWDEGLREDKLIEGLLNGFVRLKRRISSRCPVISRGRPAPIRWILGRDQGRARAV